MKLNIAIIMGGYSSEHQISQLSGQNVFKHLSRERYNPYRVVISTNKWVCLDDSDKEYPVNRADFSVEIEGKRISFHCVFNAIHGSPGEDGLMQAYFSLLGLPQTSCGYYQAALTFNKRDLLSVLKAYGINMATSYYLNEGDKINEEEILKKVGLPCFVKANRAGSSFGITKVHKPEELSKGIEHAFREDPEIIIESCLVGTEVSVGVITYKGETKVLPITEIVSENDFFDYEAKYQGKSQEITPARISEKDKKEVSRVSKMIYNTLGMKGYTRSEFILIDGVPHMLEMNTTPGLTEQSILPQQALAEGISLSELFESAVEEALHEN
ncbi:D-alanine--D-alanine ligase [Muriicola sp. E247]|uniref:D-alanine--D-alanine ligase n=1 Tax=Muriicola sp. E247 TaxID=3242730 RepID=UPI00352668F0